MSDTAHKFGDHGHWERLLSPDRQRTLPVDEILGLLAPEASDTVLDLGTGVGYLALPLARRLATGGGTVLAVDISPEALARLEARVTEAGLENVRAVQGEEVHIPLGDDTAHRAVCMCVFHEFAQPLASLRELRRVLVPGGHLLLIDWDPEQDTGHGAPLSERVPPSIALDLLQQAGFHAQRLPWKYPGCYVLSGRTAESA